MHINSKTGDDGRWKEQRELDGGKVAADLELWLPTRMLSIKSSVAIQLWPQASVIPALTGISLETPGYTRRLNLN